MGERQLRWLKNALKRSQATWKAICSDMPIGLLVRDGKEDFENAANGNGPALGRELEIADLLGFIKHQGIKNTVGSLRTFIMPPPTTTIRMQRSSKTSSRFGNLFLGLCMRVPSDLENSTTPLVLN